MHSHVQAINEKIEKVLKKTKGDVFAVFITMYDYMLEECFHKKDVAFYRKVFENARTSEDTLFSLKMKEMKPKSLMEYYPLINTQILNINTKEDLEIVIRMLYTLTRKAIVTNFKYSSKKQAREEYIKQIEYLKYGMIKKESEAK